MKKITFIVLLLVGIATSGYTQNWLTNLDTAKADATKTNRNILLVFSGSDWCAPCIKLEKNIWQSLEFQNFSKDHFVLLKADFPKMKKNQLPEQQQNHNKHLAETYNKQGFFPLVAVLNPKGEVLGTTGFKNISPKEYIDLLVSLEK